jgi:hypothetical protein
MGSGAAFGTQIGDGRPACAPEEDGAWGGELWTNDLEEAPKAGRDGAEMGEGRAGDHASTWIKAFLKICRSASASWDRHREWPYFSKWMDSLILCAYKRYDYVSGFAGRTSSFDFQGDNNCKRKTS